MARTCQQIFGTSASVHEQVQEQTQNNQHSTVDEVEEHARRLTHVERNVDTVKAIVEQTEATMMHMAQNMNSKVPRQPEQRRRQQTRREE